MRGSLNIALCFFFLSCEAHDRARSVPVPGSEKLTQSSVSAGAGGAVPTAADVSAGSSIHRAIRDTQPLSQFVVRVTCRMQAGFSQGTGFLHTSGNVITAGHDVLGCI